MGFQNEDSDDNELQQRLMFRFHVISQSRNINSHPGGMFYFVHKLGILSDEPIPKQKAIGTWNIMTSRPKILLNMLEPLKKTNAVNLTVNEEKQLLSAASFHASDVNSSTHN